MAVKWLLLLLSGAAAWDITRTNKIIAGNGTAECYNGSVILGCTCTSCDWISNAGMLQGCWFKSSSGTTFTAQIACGGGMPNAINYFNDSAIKTARCGYGGVMTDCLWKGPAGGGSPHSIDYQNNECAVNGPNTAVALCLKTPPVTVVAYTMVANNDPSGCRGAQLLGCQCTETSQNDASCSGGVTVDSGNNCVSTSNRTLRFCINQSAAPTAVFVSQTTSPTRVPTLTPTRAPIFTPTRVPTFNFPTRAPTNRTTCALNLAPNIMTDGPCKIPLPEGETCKLQCRDSDSLGGNATVTCVNGSLTPYNLNCPQGVQVTFEMEFESITCGVNLDNATVRLLIVGDFLTLARNTLNLPKTQPRVVSTTQVNSTGIECAVWFSNPTYGPIFQGWANATNMTRTFNLTSFEEPCEVVVIIKNVTIFFESLFTFLSGWTHFFSSTQ